MLRQSLSPRARSLGSIALLAIVSLLFIGPSMAQSIQQAPPLDGIAHIAIRVHNLDAARDFYKKLGFDEAFALSKDGAVYQSFIKLDDRQFIELYPTTAKDSEIGFLHLCFESDNLQAVYDDYIARGVHPNFKIRKAGAGNLLFTMKGPLQATGPQNIEYTQYMPGSRHYSDRGQHLGADRVGTKLVSVTLAMQDPVAAREFYLKQLEFTPDAHRLGVFDLPGTSGEQVEIVPVASLGSKGRITLATVSLKDSARLLKQAHVVFKKSRRSLTVTDPDGNLIVLETR
ncbi:MAG: VOC family protein [Edaphobacter sp.]|uniref:VOC family protein n=1 Tax=Edaphobacter sp. TaxID=1934404 RepID=UPI0029811169|nr:VOC family protein [Edaphobacter sp.]MDW5265789.1 VOC family protein [Edaphobacter sp.]